MLSEYTVKYPDEKQMSSESIFYFKKKQVKMWKEDG
jgi:hypothetical protein